MSSRKLSIRKAFKTLGGIVRRRSSSLPAGMEALIISIPKNSDSETRVDSALGSASSGKAQWNYGGESYQESLTPVEETNSEKLELAGIVEVRKEPAHMEIEKCGMTELAGLIQELDEAESFSMKRLPRIPLERRERYLSF
jgi:hypothetical protein